MAVDVAIVGDGPCGLSCALLAAKNDLSVQVFGPDDTAMHSAYLYNYLGVEELDGTEFMERAREQCKGVGAELIKAAVSEVRADGDGFVVATDAGDEHEARHVVLATGTDRELAQALELEMDGEVIHVDRDGRTSRDHVYAGGWATRPHKIQAAISVGDGAAIALAILSQEKGKPFHDFDTPPDG